MRRRAFAVAGCTALMGTLGGCIFSYDAPKPEVSYENNLDVTVMVHLEGAQSQFERSVASGGFSELTMEECRGTALVVETEDSELVGRVDEPACPGWALTINEDGTLEYAER